MEENKKKIEGNTKAVAQPSGLCVESAEWGSAQGTSKETGGA